MKSRFNVLCFSSSDRVVDEARKALFKTHALYGARIAARKLDSKQLKKIQDGTVTLFVGSPATNVEPSTPPSEAARLARPNGGTAILRAPLPSETPPGWRKIEKDGISAVFTRPALSGTGDWTHQYGKPDNTAYCGETLLGARSVTDLREQWFGRPGPRFRADRSGRGAAPLAVDGRLFVLGLGRALGMDAYTGTILWSRTLPGVNRFNIHHDSGNWCADKKNLYIPYGDECLVLDNKTGAVRKWFHLPVKSGSEASGWSYIARDGALLFASSTKPGTRYTDFHGAYGWYDAKSDSIRAVTCAADIFAMNADNGGKKWSYSPVGLIINPTITIADGMVFFIESSDASLRKEKKYRFTPNRLSKSSAIVALDASTGKKIWSRKVELNKNNELNYPVEAVYLSYGEGSLAFLTSRTDKKPFGTYYLTVFDGASGKPRYKKEFKWAAKDHGGHLSRPVIASGRLNIRPKTFDLKTGKVLNKNNFWGCCGTYVATKDMLIMRSGGPITLWRLDGAKWNRSSWKRLRPDCWISVAPACGMLLAPEGGGGCRCGVWMETSVGFIPKKTSK
jgi:outer membrane protein assembly factor BamB